MDREICANEKSSTIQARIEELCKVTKKKKKKIVVELVMDREIHANEKFSIRSSSIEN